MNRRQLDSPNVHAVRVLNLMPLDADPTYTQDGDVWLRADKGKVYRKVNGVVEAFCDASEVKLPDWAKQDGGVLLPKGAVGRILVTQDGIDIDPRYSTADLPESGNLYYTQDRFDNGFSGKTTSDLKEGGRLYFTPERFKSQLDARTTNDLAEGDEHLYYTPARVNELLKQKTTDDIKEGTSLYFTLKRVETSFNTLLGLKTTDSLVEGQNLYYTKQRFDRSFATKNTSDLMEGINLYWTGHRFDEAFGAKTSDDLKEGSKNLYFSDARAKEWLARRSADDIQEGAANKYYTDVKVDTRLASKTTSNLREGSNLYFTPQRVEKQLMDMGGVSCVIDAATIESITVVKGLITKVVYR